MLNLGIGLGLSGGAGGAGVVLGASEFYAPLTHSLVLTRGTGSATYTRATKAWEFGYAAAANAGADQVLIEVATGTPRFGGARYDSGTWYNTYADGSAISASSLLGYHAEGARTNNLLWSRSLQPGNNQLAWYTSTTGTNLLTNGTFDSDVAGWSNVVSGSIAWNAGGSADVTTVSYDGASAPITCTIGKDYQVTATVTGGRVYVSTSASAKGSFTSGAFATGNIFRFTATATTMYLHLSSAVAAATVNYDNISVLECTITSTLTATGLDNAANSASTLTAGAANATILQTLTLAAAARSFSAYVKRRTGTGNVYITRDGGTNWTDVTSQINSTTWTRVKIENTSVLNPQVGFKIATSGDAIDVDVCQDEAGAYASSPIITTTAAVTRNTDTLSYPSANLMNNAGTVLYSMLNLTTNSGSVSGIVTELSSTTAPVYKGDGGSKVRSWDNTSAVGTEVWPTDTLVHKAAGSWITAPPSRTITRDGLTPATFASYDGSWEMTAVHIAAPVVGTNSSIYVKEIYIWQSALTDAQLQQVTA